MRENAANFANLKKTWVHFWKRPVRVFCFHQVSDVFEDDTMWECDWSPTEAFRNKILELKEKYTFVPLTEAYRHITDDRVRLRNFAALTADDGWASLKNIIPWLAEQRIPVTLFLNPLYLDGVHYQSRETDKLLTEEEVEGLVKQYSPLVTIASHGWLHEDCRNMKEDEFEASVLKAEVALHNINGKIPFYAFAYGKFRNEQIVFLREHSLIPVLMDGTMNYNHPMIVHRECIDCGK